jgi:hypothetical protein
MGCSNAMIAAVANQLTNNAKKYQGDSSRIQARFSV